MKLFDKNSIEKYLKRNPSNTFSKYILLSKDSQVRQNKKLLNKWFNNIPNDEQKEIHTRFWITKDPWPVIFEIIMHQVFWSLGCKITFHPKIPGTNKRPDFLIKTPNGDSFYLEVRFIHQPDKFARDCDTVKILETEMQNIAIKGFKIRGDVKQVGDTLDHNIVEIFLKDEINAMRNKQIDSTIVIYNDKYWYIEFYIESIQEIQGANYQQRVKLDHPFIPDFKHINNKILKKAGKYGKLSHPYVISVNLSPPVQLPQFIHELVLGSINLLYSGNTKTWKGDTKAELDPKGLWQDRKGSKYSRVSAILLSRCFFPYSNLENDLWLILNSEMIAGQVFREFLVKLLKAKEYNDDSIVSMLNKSNRVSVYKSSYSYFVDEYNNQAK